MTFILEYHLAMKIIQNHIHPLQTATISVIIYNIDKILEFSDNAKIVYNKENIERQETNKYGRGTEQHLPKTDKSVFRPAGEHR